MQGFSHYPSLWEVLFYFWDRKKKVFCFIPLYMHFLDNNYIVTDGAGSWWLVFVKAKMWFGSGRDYASMSSSSRSLNLLSVWFCPLILRSWFGVLTFDSNCIFACSFYFFSPTSSKDRWIKKKKKTKQNKKQSKTKQTNKQTNNQTKPNKSKQNSRAAKAIFLSELCTFC